ncbi:TetR family transcriptional regulator [Curtobacterium sp. PhB137]|uniref:TetR/AcrR family transcriptional regulator n=1 Tax=Bacteria TaxID=2 RepID=UPI000F50242A|nr:MULTISPECIES: TetR/AcrR family transcriptional regulator [unclassified Curtobacterium]MBF4584789.1 TetR/AcrR family transcriptional regulator [Curtobacterium sp. VKM Ac-2887]RPE84524.1 TetR family transcriptional regulator [Curtobacterium sp. PhB137]
MDAITTRRPGSETRAQILRVALEQFTERGYEGTSIRDIAEALDITKSSLYYHFTNKEAIVRALLDGRRNEIDELIAWVESQQAGPDLLRRAAVRWVESTGRDRVQGMRFAHANRPIMQKLAAEGTDRRSWFDAVVDRVLPEAAPRADRLRAQMAFDTVSAALFAAQGSDASDDEVLEAARTATIMLTETGGDERLVGGTS